MILTYSDAEICESIAEDYALTIIAENPKILKSIVSDICSQCNGGGGNLILSENNKELKFEKTADYLLNPFDLDLNSTKIKNKIFNEMLEIAKDRVVEKAELNSQIIKIIESLFDDMIYDNLDHSCELDWLTLFKAYNVHVNTTDVELHEKIAEYIKICARVLKVSVLFCIHLHDYFTEEVILGLIELALYNKVNLIFVESHDIGRRRKEKQIIIDNDLCNIMRTEIS